MHCTEDNCYSTFKLHKWFYPHVLSEATFWTRNDVCWFGVLTDNLTGSVDIAKTSR